MKHRLRRGMGSAFLVGTCQSAYALGDSVIPQTAGLIIGVPVAVGLFWLVFFAILQGHKIVRPQWGLLLLLAVLAAMFDVVYLWLVWVFDPATWSYAAGSGKLKAGLIYLVPTGVFVLTAVLRRQPYRALAIAGSGLLVWLNYAAMHS